MEIDVPKLRRGWTTGACATAALKAGLMQLWGDGSPDTVTITLPKGETHEFAITDAKTGDGWAEVGIVKDAGDDPDVTHGALIRVRVEASDDGVVFRAGKGVGTVTMPGLPLPVGEPAINPVPRKMMEEVVAEMAAEFAVAPNVKITVSVIDGEKLAKKTWNPRLGILGGISILGTTGIVRPFSCSAWIASIHRGIDVARAAGLNHLAGCTGATSETSVQDHHKLPDQAMLDMGDFVGAVLKYIRKHPVDRVTIGGGIGKMTKLAQGARDLHSARSQIDFKNLSNALNIKDISQANTALDVYNRLGEPYADWVANAALRQAYEIMKGETKIDIVVIDRNGVIIAQAGP